MFGLDEFVEGPEDGLEDHVRVLHFLAPRKQEVCIKCGTAIYSAEKGRCITQLRTHLDTIVLHVY